MNKIVELLIDFDNLEFDDLGVEVMSLVDSPAIGIDFLAFSEQKFVEPNPGETRDEYVSRCIPVLKDEGYDDDQAAAICYNSFEEDEDEAQKAFLKLAEELGETIDWQYTTYIDGTKEEFATITDWVEGVRGLDILSRRGLTNNMVVKYRYAGPPAERNFCKAMQRLNKLYTYQELQELGRSVGNGIDLGSQAIIKWKGGPFCRHYFEKVLVSKEGRYTVIISEGRATQQELGIPMSSRPNGGHRASFAFSDDDQMIVTGPAMTPDSLILRKDEQGNPFHVFFSKDTIKKIAEKFFEYNKMNNTDVNHDDNVTTNNTLLESWIVDDPEMDKSKAMGFNVPKGTWFVSYKINDEETWQKIKKGELAGFSVAGSFIEKATRL